MAKELIIYTDTYIPKPAELAPKIQLTIPNPNWEYLVQQCPSDYMQAELSRRHKENKARTLLTADKTPIFFEPTFTAVERKPINLDLQLSERDEDK